MVENKETTQTKQPLTESASGLNKSNPTVAQDSMENVSKIVSVRVQNSASGISACAPVATTAQPVTSQAQSGSIGACAPDTGKQE